MTDPWQPSDLDKYLESMRRLWGGTLRENPRFGDVVRKNPDDVKPVDADSDAGERRPR
jgi:hypothetical protein